MGGFLCAIIFHIILIGLKHKPTKERGEADDIISMYLAGCCRDAGKDIGTFGPEDLLNILKRKQGKVSHKEHVLQR